MKLSPWRPYLVRALYEWIVDNGLTPYLLVNAGIEGVRVPAEFVSDGKIVLNIAPSAVRELRLHNDGVFFGARFSGRPHEIVVPIKAVQAIYAKENGKGIVFSADEFDGSPPDEANPASNKKPNLKIVTE